MAITLADLLPPKEELEAADDKVAIIHLCSGQTSDGRDFFAYVAMWPSRYMEYIEATQRGDDVLLREFGDILESGYGLVPSERVQEEMKRKYGVDPTFFEELTKEIIAGAADHSGAHNGAQAGREGV